MRSEERGEFTTVISALAATFNSEPTEALFEGYWLGLRDLPITAVKRAAARAIRDMRFIPKPIELRELAGELSPQDRAVKAWGAVMYAFQLFGYYRTITFDDPVTAATVRHVWHNWMQFAEAFETEKETWIRKEFERVYCSLFRSGVSAEAARPLVGYFERENTLHGYHKGDEIRGHRIDNHITIACHLPPVPLIGRSPERKRLPPADVKLLEGIGRNPQETAT